MQWGRRWRRPSPSRRVGLAVKRAGKDDVGDWVLRSDHPAWLDAPWPDDAEMIGKVRWAGWSLS